MAAMWLWAAGCDSENVKEQENEVYDPLLQLKADGDLIGSLRPFDLVVNPAYTPVHELYYMQDDEQLFISKACGTLLVYPHRNMFVEVVNEEAHGVYMAVTYCPITRSGIGVNRVLDSDTLLLTASGYLFRENMVPLDINSGSLWSQMQLKGLKGGHESRTFSTLPMIETTWKTVRENFPSAGVFIADGYLKSSGLTGRTEDFIGSFGQDYGILSGKKGVEFAVELFSMEMFPGEITLETTTVRPGGSVVVAGSTTFQYITSFLTTYRMEPVEGQFPVIMKDETGTFWNIFGEAVSGERGGETLSSPLAYTAADWAWMDLFDEVEYHGD